jgi:hypothetical protein
VGSVDVYTVPLPVTATHSAVVGQEMPLIGVALDAGETATRVHAARPMVGAVETRR